jgi:hypothetical protein
MLSQLSPGGAGFLSKISDKSGIARIGKDQGFRVSRFQSFNVSVSRVQSFKVSGFTAQNTFHARLIKSSEPSSLLQSSATTKISHGRYFSVSRAAL